MRHDRQGEASEGKLRCFPHKQLFNLLRAHTETSYFFHCFTPTRALACRAVRVVHVFALVFPHRYDAPELHLLTQLPALL